LNDRRKKEIYQDVWFFHGVVQLIKAGSWRCYCLYCRYATKDGHFSTLWCCALFDGSGVMCCWEKWLFVECWQFYPSFIHFGDRCFAAAGPRLWNSLPINLRQCWSLEQFKRSLKTFLF